MKVSLLSLLSGWAQLTGESGREVNKAKQTLHLYGMANHYADTYYMSHRIKAGMTQETAQAKQSRNFMRMFCRSLCHSQEIQSLLTALLKSMFRYRKMLLSYWNKVKILNFSWGGSICMWHKSPAKNRSSSVWFISDSFQDLSPHHMSLSWGQIISVHREISGERGGKQKKTQGGKRKMVAGGRNNCSNIVHYNNSYITRWHVN